MDYKNLYGGEVAIPMPTQVKTRNSLTYEDKQNYETIPEGAEITSRNVEVKIREINNGYIKCVSTSTEYKVKEGDDVRNGYCYNYEETYFKEKPLDILKLYV